MPHNGVSKLIWWLLGTAVSVLMLVGAGWISSVESRITSGRQFSIDTREEQIKGGERFVRIETILQNVERQLLEVNKKLDLLERRLP